MEGLISVGFWIAGEGDKEEQIFKWYAETYPHYHVGDKIWLEVIVMPISEFEVENPLNSGCYIIADIQHVLRKHYTKTIDTFCSIEVYVKPYKKEEATK